VNGDLERCCKAKIGPALSGYRSEASSRSAVKTGLTLVGTALVTRPLTFGAVVACHWVSPGWNKAGHPLPYGKSSATSLTCAFSSYPASSRSYVPSLCPRWRTQPDHPGRVKERHPLIEQNDT
jgi:hypothetical protein